jgi:hypothetical protein
MVKSDVIQKILDKCRTAAAEGQGRDRLARRSPAAGGGFTGPARRHGTRRPPRDPQTGSRLSRADRARRPRRA